MAGPVIDFSWLRRLQADKGLRLVTDEAPAGIVHVDQDAAAFVAQLIRLAEIGQKLEQAMAAEMKGRGH